MRDKELRDRLCELPVQPVPGWAHAAENVKAELVKTEKVSKMIKKILYGRLERLEARLRPDDRLPFDQAVWARSRDGKPAGSSVAFPRGAGEGSPMEIALKPPQWTVYCCPTRFRVLVAGRRFGKTFLACAELLRSASDPAFGEAALAAIRMWRFLPSVRNGTPVATNAVIPFVFDPPSPP